MVDEGAVESVFDFYAFLVDDSGATAIEYALIASLISLAIMVSVAVLGGSLNGLWQFIRDEVVAATTF